MGEQWMNPEDFHVNRDQLEFQFDDQLHSCLVRLGILEKQDSLYFGDSPAHLYFLEALSDTTEELLGYRADAAVLREKLTELLKTHSKQQQDAYPRERKLLHESIFGAERSVAKMVALIHGLGEVYKKTARANGDLNGAWMIFTADVEEAAEYMKKIVEADKNDISF